MMSRCNPLFVRYQYSTRIHGGDKTMDVVGSSMEYRWQEQEQENIGHSSIPPDFGMLY